MENTENITYRISETGALIETIQQPIPDPIVKVYARETINSALESIRANEAHWMEKQRQLDMLEQQQG